MTDFVRTIDLELGLESAALSFGNDGAEERVELMLEQFSAGIAPDDPLKARLSGKLLEEPVTLTMSGPNLIQFLDDDAWPVRLEGKAAAIDLFADGVVTTPTDTTGLLLNVSIGGDQFGELSSWIGVDPESQLTYEIKAVVGVTEKTWEVTVRSASLGQTSLRGRLSGEIGDSTAPSSSAQRSQPPASSMIPSRNRWIVSGNSCDCITDRSVSGIPLCSPQSDSIASSIPSSASSRGEG